MGLEIADLRGLGEDYSGEMVVYLQGGSNPITDEEWATYVPDPGFILNTPRNPAFDELIVLGSPYEPTGVYTYYTDGSGFTWQAVSAVENRVYPFSADDYTGYDPPVTSSAQAGYVVVTPLPGTIQYNSNNKNHENIYYALDTEGQPKLQYFITDPWGNVYILKSVNAENDTPEEIAAAIESAVLPDASWVKSTGYLTEDFYFLPAYSGDIAHANDFRDSGDNAWTQIVWGSSGITLASVIGEGLPIWGGNDSDYLKGTAKDDEIRGGAGNDVIEGVDGTDRISGDVGNDTIIGGSGTTTALYLGASDEYKIRQLWNGITIVTDTVADRDGKDVLIDVRYLEFSDGTKDLDAVPDFGWPGFSFGGLLGYLFRTFRSRAEDQHAAWMGDWDHSVTLDHDFGSDASTPRFRDFVADPERDHGSLWSFSAAEMDPFDDRWHGASLHAFLADLMP